MNSFIDQYLLYRIRAQGDAEAFARLYDRYVEAIYRFVSLKLPAKEVAEDVTSETFLRGWQYIQKTPHVEHVRALFYSIARRLVADYYRAHGETRVTSVTFLSSHTSSYTERQFSDHEAGRGMIEARAETALILRQIARLKEDFQDVLTLRLIDGLKFDDIAKILGKTSGHVRVIYHRALKALEGITDGSST